MRISKVTKRTGLSADTLRYYERIGLISPITLQAIVGGNEVTNPFMVTEVYVQQDHNWKLASLTFTKLLAAEQHHQ